MKITTLSLSTFIVLGGLFGCSAAEDGSSQGARVVVDQRCTTAKDCPAGFQCEIETEHGITQSYCVAHVEDQSAPDAAPVSCPLGFEAEIEHNLTFCKAHKSGTKVESDASTGDSGSSSLDGGSNSCQTNADCPPGLECEIQVQNNVTTSQCKAHGGK